MGRESLDRQNDPQARENGQQSHPKHSRIEKLDPQTPSISAIKPPCQLEMNATNRTIRTQNQATVPTRNERNEPYHMYTHTQKQNTTTLQLNMNAIEILSFRHGGGFCRRLLDTRIEIQKTGFLLVNLAFWFVGQSP